MGNVALWAHFTPSLCVSPRKSDTSTTHHVTKSRHYFGVIRSVSKPLQHDPHSSPEHRQPMRLRSKHSLQRLRLRLGHVDIRTQLRQLLDAAQHFDSADSAPSAPMYSSSASLNSCLSSDTGWLNGDQFLHHHLSHWTSMHQALPERHALNNGLGPAPDTLNALEAVWSNFL